MPVNTQGAYAFPEVGNYLERVEGDSYQLSPLTFHEFLTKPDSAFFFSDEFFQIPQYEREILSMDSIPEYAREAIRQFIVDEFEDRLLGMEDYRRWGRKFRQKCEQLTVPFWAQVNMASIMRAVDLEMDETTSTRTNTSQHGNTGGQTTKTEQASNGATLGKQLTDASARTATLTTVAAGDIVSDDIDVDWSKAADDMQETRTRAGDTEQKSNSASNATTVVSNNSNATTTNIASDSSEYTNKQFMQERKYAIETAQNLMPRAWLKTQLSGMFFLLR
jgi:hypothetical protein